MYNARCNFVLFKSCRKSYSWSTLKGNRITLLIVLLLTRVRLNSYLSDSNTNLPKYATPHLTPPTLLEISASSLTNILPSLTKLHLAPKPVTYLDLSTVCTIATSIVHSKLDYCNSLYCRLLKSQLSRHQQTQNSLARTVVKAPKSCHIIPIQRSLHWLKITECIEYKLLSLTYKVLTTTNLHTFITSSLFNVLAILALHLLLFLLGHRHHPF